MTTARGSLFGKPAAAERDELMRLFVQHVVFEVFAARVGIPAPTWPSDPPASSFQSYLNARYSPLPESVTKAAGYRDLLAAMSELGSNAIAEFRDLRDRDGLGPAS